MSRALLLFVLAGCASSPPAPSLSVVPAEGSAYAETVAALDSRIAGQRARADRLGSSYTAYESLAAALRERASLTGRLEDYLEAERTLDRSFDLAVEGAGPFLTRAKLRYSLHQMEDARGDLDRFSQRVVMNQSTAAEVAGLRGEIELCSGRFTEAKVLFDRAFELHANTPNAFRLAHWYWQTGDYTEAERWLDRAEGYLNADARQARSWLELQRGLLDLDRGRYSSALAHYLRADRLFPGHWLIQEHMAEASAALGDLESAERIYWDVVRRTQSPELMDALADVLEARGKREQAGEVRAQAAAGFERDLALAPSAAGGHALDHFLAHGEPSRTLELARAAHALRPGGAEQVKLAQAYLLNGELVMARQTIEGTLETPYRHAELFETASIIHARSGDTERAAREHELALAIDPTVSLPHLTQSGS